MYGFGHDEHGPAYPVGAAVKFKVGDRVRFTDRVNGYWWFKAGETGTISQVDDCDGYRYHVELDAHDGDEAFVDEEHIELVPPVAEPKFKVGDRVRVLVDYWAPDAGIDKTGIVHEVLQPPTHTEGFTIVIDGGDCFAWFFSPEEIEMINADEPVGTDTFRANDRLRLKRHTATLAAGDIVVVSEVDGFGVYATCVNGRSHYIVNDAVEAAPKPKFKAGDRVRSLKFPQYVYTIARVKTEYSPGEPYDGPTAYDYASTTGWDLESSIELDPAAPPPQPAIVALISHGKPRPSTYPHLHASVDAATTEAERLAKINPGQEFAVFQRVAGRVCEVSYEMKEVA